MANARYLVGDVFQGLATLEDNSVDLVFSSPPFLALRSYLPSDHINKHREIGSEATPADFLDTLLDVVEACDRVLAPHGSLCFELGDTYANSGGAGGDYAEDGFHDGQPKFRQVYDPNAWPLPKSLSGIPTLFAWSLAYGRNLLRPERTTPRWRIRNVIVWARPNPPVGALGDKFRPATSYLTVACKSDRRWFDLDAVRGESTGQTRDFIGAKREATMDGGPLGAYTSEMAAAGAPPLDYWEIPTQPYAGSHYATFPDKLVVKPVKAMCPSKVCRVCGEPSRRIVEQTNEEYAAAATITNRKKTHAKGDTRTTGYDKRETDPEVRRAESAIANKLLRPEFTTLGWSDCGCACPRGCGQTTCVHRWRNGVTLDPFAGSGTTLAVATGHGRDAIGVDLDERNAELALERVGPLFLTVEQLSESKKPFVPHVVDVETEAV